MCTVSFIAADGNKYMITSNRDEHISRPLSFRPKEEVINNCKLAFPKDPKAGGTWFAINEHGAVGVLLNGAFHKHVPSGGYAKSRGQVLLEIVSTSLPMRRLKEIDLENIEPFTIILFQNYELLEFRWDGTRKYFKDLSIAQNYIWSSATLYNKEVRLHREGLFSKFLKQNGTIDPGTIIDFHSNNNDDPENGFVINRTSGLKTFSVTQAILEKDVIVLDHVDLINQKKHSISLHCNRFSNQLL